MAPPAVAPVAAVDVAVAEGTIVAAVVVVAAAAAGMDRALIGGKQEAVGIAAEAEWGRIANTVGAAQATGMTAAGTAAVGMEAARLRRLCPDCWGPSACSCCCCCCCHRPHGQARMSRRQGCAAVDSWRAVTPSAVRHGRV